MISKRTVIVTGAGASIPYGYPSGRRLVDYIVENLSGKPWTTRIPIHSAGSGLIFEEQSQEFSDLIFYEEAGFTDSEVESFLRKLQSSNIDSIDSFLEHNSDYLEIGKFAIANLILKFECSLLLNFSSENWLRYLWQILSEKKQEFRRNKLTFITFNYDRVLEEFLFTSISNLYGVDKEEAVDLMSNIQIMHLHGRLAPLPWEDSKNGYPYGYDGNFLSINHEKILQSANELKIIHESQDMKIFDEAKEVLTSTERIYLLGYGYHPINNERLGLKYIEKRIHGTAYGLTENEVEQIKLRGNLSLLNAVNENNYDFLRNHFYPN